MEMLDVYTPEGEMTGKAVSYDEVHAKGLWHKTIHLWIINNMNQILLQRRSKDKISHPDMWDISAAGHISAGEDNITALKRECKEELGLDIDESEVVMLGTIRAQSSEHAGEYINNEFQDAYLIKLDIGEDDVYFDDGEVQYVKFVTIPEFKEMVKNSRELVSHPDEYSILIEYLTQPIK